MREFLERYVEDVYKRQVKKVMGVWQYDDEDISRLSTIMTPVSYTHLPLKVYKAIYETEVEYVSS